MYKLNDFFEDAEIISDGDFISVGNSISEHPYSVCFAVNLKHVKLANENTNISCIITSKTMAKFISEGKGRVVSNEPDICFGKLKNKLLDLGELSLFENFYIDSSLKIGASSSISDKVKIGKNVVIGENCIIYEYCIIDDDVIIGDNVVLGCDGFYFKRNVKGELIKLPHLGGVHIHKNVEIMTGSMVQRAHDLDYTVIGEGTKISVNCNIGHSSKIGMHNMVTGNVQIAGRVKMGSYCWIGTSSTLSDSVSLGNHCEVKIGSVVIQDVTNNQVVSGNFSVSHKNNMRDFISRGKNEA